VNYACDASASCQRRELLDRFVQQSTRYFREREDAVLAGAYRAGKKIEYDGSSGQVTNAPEANAFLCREYRAGWPLNT
jgi:hypothetical protein